MKDKTAEMRSQAEFYNSQIKLYKERIEAVKEIKQSLRKEFKQGWISEEEYKQKLMERLHGLGSKKLLRHYGKQINEYLQRINDYDHQLKQQEKVSSQKFVLGNWLPKSAALIAILLILIPAFIFLKPGLTGLIVGQQGGAENIVQKTVGLNLEVNESQDYVLSINETGELKSIKASGKLIGSGSGRIYLVHNGTRLLIYDSANQSG